MKDQGTDLMRTSALLTPEFELSQFASLSSPLERCVIYDGGARAFNVPDYLEDVRSYWEKMKELAGEGMTLEEALVERWPGAEYELSFSDFQEAKSKTWEKTDPDLLQQLYQGHQERWTDEFRGRARNPRPLIELCRQRLRTLQLP